MNSENVVKQLRVLWRTDRIIAEIRMRHMLVGLGLRAFAALIAAFGLLMLELSAYFALVQIWSAISAAAILGVVNFAIARLTVPASKRPKAAINAANARRPSPTSICRIRISAMMRSVRHSMRSCLTIFSLFTSVSPQHETDGNPEHEG